MKQVRSPEELNNRYSFPEIGQRHPLLIAVVLIVTELLAMNSIPFSDDQRTPFSLKLQSNGLKSNHRSWNRIDLFLIDLFAK
jgi:hypothetical protein